MQITIWKQSSGFQHTCIVCSGWSSRQSWIAKASDFHGDPSWFFWHKKNFAAVERIYSTCQCDLYTICLLFSIWVSMAIGKGSASSVLCVNTFLLMILTPTEPFHHPLYNFFLAVVSTMLCVLQKGEYHEFLVLFALGRHYYTSHPCAHTYLDDAAFPGYQTLYVLPCGQQLCCWILPKF